MISWTNITALNGNAPTYGTGPAVFTGNGGGTGSVVLWCATARDMNADTANDPNNVTQESSRTASLCYMVGLKERVRIQTSDGLPWMWRRICFTMKGGVGMGGAFTPTTTFLPVYETGSGYVRLLNQSPNAGTSISIGNILFRGTNGNDWYDWLTAKVDTRHVTLKYDKTVSICAGNEDGMFKVYPRWHSMRSNLAYNDSENGGTDMSTRFSTYGRAGMGDYWIVDYLQPRGSSTGSSQLSFEPEATLYWHEK